MMSGKQPRKPLYSWLHSIRKCRSFFGYKGHRLGLLPEFRKSSKRKCIWGTHPKSSTFRSVFLKNYQGKVLPPGSMLEKTTSRGNTIHWHIHRGIWNASKSSWCLMIFYEPGVQWVNPRLGTPTPHSGVSGLSHSYSASAPIHPGGPRPRPKHFSPREPDGIPGLWLLSGLALDAAHVSGGMDQPWRPLLPPFLLLPAAFRQSIFTEKTTTQKTLKTLQFF